MFEQPIAIFLVNLVQDVNILRPLTFMATRDFGFRALILASSKFAERDLYGIWRSELQALAGETGAEVRIFEDDFEAFKALQGTGIIFAGSESSLPGHSTTHAIFQYAPPTFLKVTLQHGFECVGFRHSPAHDRAHGHNVSFGADIVCAWQPLQLQTSMAPSQGAKAVVTGPTAVLQTFIGPNERRGDAPGLVCENLHSVRLNSTAELKSEFVGAFNEFCRLQARDNRDVVLRPHPGGQYALKNKVELPPNASINNAPLYRVDLRQYAYGISAPSSVLIDMLLADIPTAVWRDEGGSINADNYAGLSGISAPGEWRDFAREAAARPETFLELQRRFLGEQMIPIEPHDVFMRFAQVFEAARHFRVGRSGHRVPGQRLLFIANARLPTLQVCLERPLAPLVRSGELASDLLTEAELRRRENALGSPEAVREWLDGSFDRLAPDALLFSRYSGPYAAEMLEWAKRNRVPTIYHIDDDLLAVPKELGERKHAYHNAPERLQNVRTLLSGADIIYASTAPLRDRLLGYYPEGRVVAGAINCSGRIIRVPEQAAATTIGYMASFDHLANLLMVMPAIERVLDRHPRLSFELFGSIPVPERLGRFGDRVRKVGAVSDYESFLRALSERRWAVGICPLTNDPFNFTKSNNKWVEYTSAGIATVASADTIYDECCADGCGILAGNDEEWFVALDRLVTDDELRSATVVRAQQKLESNYGIDEHRQQILGIIAMARQAAAKHDAPKSKAVEVAA